MMQAKFMETNVEPTFTLVAASWSTEFTLFILGSSSLKSKLGLPVSKNKSPFLKI
jgi:hypothetical protein